MRLGSFLHRGRRFPGRVEGPRVIDLSQKGRFQDLGQVLAAGLWPGDLEGGPEVPRSEAVPLAPVPLPPKIVAVGLNYADHAREQGRTAPPEPIFFAKARTSVIGPEEPILLPPWSRHTDVEVELVVVMGRRAARVPAARALEHVLGFTVGNDVSERRIQKEDGQFYRAKSYRTFASTGPLVVTPEAFDHRSAPLRLRLNGRLQQDSCTGQMCHTVEKLVEILSSVHDLEPGDLIFTGTPAGVGVFPQPRVFLQEGDVVECEIEGIGVLRNPVQRAREV
jgi:2-keto-4-pentenoate hydratase/2-oxohepta-3-ene-1,7-dioic acid hydratase in catechol pathway